MGTYSATKFIVKAYIKVAARNNGIPANIIDLSYFPYLAEFQAQRVSNGNDSDPLKCPKHIRPAQLDYFTSAPKADTL